MSSLFKLSLINLYPTHTFSKYFEWDLSTNAVTVGVGKEIEDEDEASNFEDILEKEGESINNDINVLKLKEEEKCDKENKGL